MPSEFIPLTRVKGNLGDVIVERQSITSMVHIPQTEEYDAHTIIFVTCGSFAVEEHPTEILKLIEKDTQSGNTCRSPTQTTKDPSVG